MCGNRGLPLVPAERLAPMSGKDGPFPTEPNHKPLKKLPLVLGWTLSRIDTETRHVCMSAPGCMRAVYGDTVDTQGQVYTEPWENGG